MKKTVISFLMAGLLLIGMPALAQEGDLPDPEWQAVVTEQGGTRWDLDTATIMKRGEGRVAGFRKTQPDGSYGAYPRPFYEGSPYGAHYEAFCNEGS